MIKFHARTDVGLRRKHNEDSLLAAESFGLFVVADGVGGRNAGEIASALAVHTFQTFGPQFRAALDAFAAKPDRSTRNAVLTLLDTVANAASKKIYEAAQTTNRQGMTTTLVALAVGGGAAFLCHVGDSRAYLLRQGELRQVTEDHSMINEMIRTGAITAADAENSKYRHVITRALGMYPTVRSDTAHVDLMEGDRLILCSDGVHDMVTPARLLELASLQNVGQSVDQIVAASLEGGGKDNITCIAVDPDATLAADAVEARAHAMQRLFLFEDLPEQARLRVGRIVSERFVRPDERIVARGEMGDALFVVVQGEMSVQVDGREVFVMRAGDHFGEMALIDHEPRSADIVARGFGHLLVIDRDTFRDFCNVEPSVGNRMLWKLASGLATRLRSMNEQLRARA